jgi:hypothetical protein
MSLFRFDLFIQVRSGWVPVKLVVDVNVPDMIDLEALRGKGLQANEQPMPGSSGTLLVAYS